ncbi:short chain dehydrogenase family protein [Paenibacillus mucilaginosus 3016]|uniref:Short chain dehydrogenase family protein n=1 Tax=Paenibacillus mucilaginosus 3016 TaxID=1116391 RepID=H6NFP4_9BACL|nr:SDR family NAD(P)-dependent oxidoreductase [Paenibacillus mucilaginosus]AFC30684.1 short chain dehydrogenase family protein [Paenibacillus mucilaginosus 3016]WFA19294.1 SDR family NAD(P)-dependent oxidoreductase [Paenibacillus mucilaginosus]
MTKKTAVITGATSGLGQLVALELGRRGFHLVLTARSKDRAAHTKKQMEEKAPSAKVDFFYADLSLLKDVNRVGNEIAAAYPAIDVLLNNAGIHAFEARVTPEGLPEMIAVNYLAPWLLTHRLKPCLQNAGKARIVNVASEASRRHGKLKLPEDLTDSTPFTALGSSPIYGKTKLFNIMFTAELARRWAGTGISVNALNPGFNVTGLGRELWFAPLLERMLKLLRLGDPRRGADLMTRLMVEPKYQQITGGYFTVGTGTSIEPAYPGGDAAMQRKLWEATEALLETKGFPASKIPGNDPDQLGRQFV